MSRVPHRVVIVGAGVAGLEAVVALHDLAGPAVTVTVVAPNDRFAIRALSVQALFSGAKAKQYAVGRACWEHGAHHVRGVVAAVLGERPAIRMTDGSVLGCDSLVVASGAHARSPFEQGATFRDDRDAGRLQRVVHAVEAGVVRRVALVVPDAVTWALPLYELALLLADRARRLRLPGVELLLVTPEPRPLTAFGAAASDRVSDALDEVRVAVRTDCVVRAIDGSRVVGLGGVVIADADVVIAAPILTGAVLQGLPGDADGFVAVDEAGRVEGRRGVYAAGDVTAYPVKQGGLAAQQADAVARAVTRDAGVDVELRPFAPVLRAKLLTGARAAYLRNQTGGDIGSEAAGHTLWWPPSKVAAPHLAPYLEQYDRSQTWQLQPRARDRPGPQQVLHATGDPAGGIEILR